jgi:hypothetical protein
MEQLSGLNLNLLLLFLWLVIVLDVARFVIVHYFYLQGSLLCSLELLGMFNRCRPVWVFGPAKCLAWCQLPSWFS